MSRYSGIFGFSAWVGFAMFGMGGIACNDIDIIDESTAVSQAGLTTEDSFQSKVAESVRRRFENGKVASAKSETSAEPVRILVFHDFGDQVRLKDVSVGRATQSSMDAVAENVASEQEQVVGNVAELTARKSSKQTSLKILDRPLYNHFVVMETNRRSDVEWLAEQDWVTEIREDKLNKLFTVEGRALTGSDTVEQNGYDGTGVGIAIIDTRFDLLHPELGGSTTLPNGIVFGGSNFSDPGQPIHSQNFNDCYHGTGTLSIARRYATDADMYGLTVFPNAYDSVIVNAINWCITNRNGVGGGAPIRVISMSLGGGAYSAECPNDTIGQAAADALAYGIVTFAAAGNEGYTSQLASPACSPSVISVGSVWDEDNAAYTPFSPAYCSDNNRLVNERTCYSNTASFLDLYAPSEEVICALCGGGTWALGGTSSACPAAAGMTAQLFDADSTLIGDMNGVLQRYQSTGVPVVGDSDEVRIDLAAAVGGGSGDTVVYNSSDTPIPIPDNNATGITSTIAVSESENVTAVSVDVNITHTYIGDLIVQLICPNGTSQILHNREGGGSDNIVKTYSVTACNGSFAAGNWKLSVSDRAGADVGTLNSWTLHATLGQPSGGTVDQASADTPIAIPDNNSTGITSTIPISSTGTVSALTVDIDITHTYIGDLIVRLICPDGTVSTLHNRTGGSADNIHQTYTVSACNGKSMSGNWRLNVSDRAGADVGTLNSWTLHITY